MGESEPGSGFEPFPSGPAPGILPGFFPMFRDLGAVVVPSQAGGVGCSCMRLPLTLSPSGFFLFLAVTCLHEKRDSHF